MRQAALHSSIHMATGRDKYTRQSLGGSLQARIKQVQL